MRTALITGATGAIGSAAAHLFAARGFAIALQYCNDTATAQELLAKLAADGAGCAVFRADLSKRTEAERMFAEIHKKLGTVSVLINSAGYAPRQDLFSRFTEEEYNKTFDLNVRGLMDCARLASEEMRGAGGGAIVNISSVWGVVGASCEVLYSASKAAIIGFTKALAKELAPSNIRVNCLAPGFVRSKMNAHLSDEDIEALRREIPLGRFGSAREMAEAIYFLATHGYITGQTLIVDGGWQ